MAMSTFILVSRLVSHARLFFSDHLQLISFFFLFVASTIRIPKSLLEYFGDRIFMPRPVVSEACAKEPWTFDDESTSNADEDGSSTSSSSDQSADHDCAHSPSIMKVR